jgi:hypothetical protein
LRGKERKKNRGPGKAHQVSDGGKSWTKTNTNYYKSRALKKMFNYVTFLKGGRQIYTLSENYVFMPRIYQLIGSSLRQNCKRNNIL